MAQPKHDFFFEMLKLLKYEDLDKLREFSLAPYLDCNENCIKIFEIVSKNAKKGETKYQEIIWLRREVMGIKTLRYFNGPFKQAIDVLQQFLVQEQLKKEPNQARILLLNALTAYSLDDEVGNQLTRLKTDLVKEKVKSVDFYSQSYSYEDLKRKYLAMRYAKKHKAEHNFEEALTALTQFHLLAKLKYTVFLLHWNSVTNKKTAPHLIKEIMFLVQLHENLIEDIPPLKIYTTLFLLWIDEGEEKDIPTLLDYLKKHEAHLAKEEVQEIYILIEQMLIKKVNTKPLNLFEINKVYADLFIVYQYLGSNDFLKEGQFIPQARFKNIISVVIQVKTTKPTYWVLQFLDNEIDKINPIHQYEVKRFGQAIIEFYTGKYKASLNKLGNYTSKIDNYYYLDAWSLKLRCYFELNMYVECRDKIKYLKKVIEKNQRLSLLSDNKKLEYQNFLSFLKELIDLCEPLSPINKSKLKGLKLTIEKTVPVASKKWFLEKIDELLWTERKHR